MGIGVGQILLILNWAIASYVHQFSK